ncbi:MAG TPA: transglycosylase family protein [Acidimicrobiales bacterium]
MTAVVGLIAVASSADAGSSGASPVTPRPPRAARAATPRAGTVIAFSTRAPRLPDADRAAMDEEDRAERVRVVTAAAQAGERSRRAAQADRVWRALAVCESNANPTAHSANGLYHGAFQFSLPTWRGLGYTGDPADHPYAVQLQAAKKLQARSGWRQWPSCARRLGLL